MNSGATSRTHEQIVSRLLIAGLMFILFLAWLTMNAKAQTRSEESVFIIHATHVLGFQPLPRNVSGQLSVDSKKLRFQQNGHTAAELSLASIQSIIVGQQDKQVGGVPVMLGKAAVPFGGGRVVSLFSHKKYDTVAIECLDDNNGLHGMIFRVPTGQGEKLKVAIVSHQAIVAHSEERAPVQTSVELPTEAQKWSVQVDRVDPGETALDACFRDAVYENLLHQFQKSTQFSAVFRAGDRNANGISELLILKTMAQKYSPGSETRRAVTTVAGATKLKVDMQLVTRNGEVVLERTIEGNVWLLGDNLDATTKLARNAAKIVNRSTLPKPLSLNRKQLAQRN